ncbi:MAG TPA: FAD-dependent oxidoreductase [Longimicrobiaceae bacterium]|nr:FAD-dependent oxidoreductase [Longimicrobiaceae bacterium]
MEPPRLLLLGGGHTHVQVLDSLARSDWPPTRVVLLSPDRGQFYTGMVPGYLQGQYAADELTIDLPKLCAAAGAEFVAGVATRIRAGDRTVETTAGALEYDLLSLDIGSVPRGGDVPGVREHAWALRPLQRAVELRERLESLADAGGTARVVVVGGGAAGVEVALAVRRALERRGGHPSVAVVDRETEILQDYPGRARRIARDLLNARGIDVRTGREVNRIEPGRVSFVRGDPIAADLVIWATGPAAPPLMRESGLPCTPDGFLMVRSSLQVPGEEGIWGAGDCVDVEGYDVPKAGVFAVRQGPVLTRNLRAAIAGEEPTPYRPQGAFLSILNTADDRALLRWRALLSHSRAAWRLKDWIDRRWMARFRTPLPPAPASAPGTPSDRR